MPVIDASLRRVREQGIEKVDACRLEVAMEHRRVEIQAVGPGDRPALRLNPHLRERIVLTCRSVLRRSLRVGLGRSRSERVTAAYITDSSQYGSDFIHVAGAKAATGAYMTDIATGGPSSSMYRYLASQLRSRYHQAPTLIDANGFDAFLAVRAAAERAKSVSPGALIASMHKVSFNGATGHVSFLPDGDRAQVNYVVVQVTAKQTYKTVYKYFRTLS